VLSLLIVAIAVRTPALSGDRIWDDNYLIWDNPFIKSPLLLGEIFRHYLFLDSYSAHYRPIQNVSFMLDYFFWDANTFGFHLTNVLLHAGSAVALYFLIRKLLISFRRPHLALPIRFALEKRVQWISHVAFLIAMLWVVHPVHSAAVDYISGRADSLAFIFATVSWLLFMRALISANFTRTLFFISAGTCGLLALLSREIACIWILLFVGHLLFVEKQVHLRLRLQTVGWCAMLLILYWSFRQLPEQEPPTPLDVRYPIAVRTVLMARSLGDYARLMIFPAKLHMERTILDGAHPYSFGDRGSLDLEYLSILGLILFGVFVVGSAWKGRGQAARLFGASWFLSAYLPISNIVQLNATVAEHWLYLPSVGFLIFMAGCLFELPARYRSMVAGIAITAVGLFGMRSFLRSGDWTSEEVFYNQTFRAGSKSARVALNLGQIYANRRDYVEAEKIFRSVLSQNPGYPLAQNNLGAVLYREGKVKEAEALFAEVQKNSSETSKEYPRTWVGAISLADVFYNAGNYQAAAAVVAKALKDNPQVWDLVGLECEILRKSDQIDLALQLAQDFAREHWWHYGVHLALARLYAQKGDALHAEQALADANRLDIHETEALRMLVFIRLRQNRLDDAFRTQRRVLARHPDEPRQYLLLAEILEKMGRNNEARAALTQVSRLRALVATSSSHSL
jgi:tetratricopeptide (TPR) repeat protein